MIMNYVQVCVLLFICHCCNIHHANYNTVEKTGVVQAFLPHSSLHLHTSSFATRRSSIDDVNNFEENAKDPIEGNFRIIKGKNKWLGGAVDPNDGSIYGVPSNANEIICLRPSSKTKQTPYEIHTIPLPRHVKKGKFKWLRGIICNNCLYGIPAWNKDGVLKLDLGKLWKSHDDNDIDGISSSLEPTDGNSRDNCVSIIPLPEEFYREKEIMPNTWLWHGAALNKNQTAIYCIPSNARQVLKVDLLESKCSFLDIPETLTSTPLAQTNKWYGGITGNDNAIYGIPYSASNVLRIDANTDRVSLLGNFGLKEYNWHGGIKSDINGCIYCFPAHHSHVLKIDTTTETNGEDEEDVNRLSMVSIKRASYDNDKVTRYKWLGGSLGADGNIYGTFNYLEFLLQFYLSLLITVVSCEQVCHLMLLVF
jgi:hypothetical protein